MQKEGADEWLWTPSNRGIYTTKSAYMGLTGAKKAWDSVALRCIWNKFLPLKVSAFLWKALLSQLPTSVNLRKWGIPHGNLARSAHAVMLKMKMNSTSLLDAPMHIRSGCNSINGGTLSLHFRVIGSQHCCPGQIFPEEGCQRSGWSLVLLPYGHCGVTGMIWFSTKGGKCP
ncbi:hypothetical protein Ancab_040393 [Ancistrocladus abbreviatus]